MIQCAPHQSRSPTTLETRVWHFIPHGPLQRLVRNAGPYVYCPCGPQTLIFAAAPRSGTAIIESRTYHCNPNPTFGEVDTGTVPAIWQSPPAAAIHQPSTPSLGLLCQIAMPSLHSFLTSKLSGPHTHHHDWHLIPHGPLQRKLGPPRLIVRFAPMMCNCQDLHCAINRAIYHREGKTP